MEPFLKDSRSLGAYVRRRRKEAGLRQTDLADAAGVSYRFVLDLENGKPTCQLGKALRILDMLGVRLRPEARPAAPGRDRAADEDLEVEAE